LDFWFHRFLLRCAASTQGLLYPGGTGSFVKFHAWIKVLGIISVYYFGAQPPRNCIEPDAWREVFVFPSQTAKWRQRLEHCFNKFGSGKTIVSTQYGGVSPEVFGFWMAKHTFQCRRDRYAALAAVKADCAILLWARRLGATRREFHRGVWLFCAARWSHLWSTHASNLLRG